MKILLCSKKGSPSLLLPQIVVGDARTVFPDVIVKSASSLRELIDMSNGLLILSTSIIITPSLPLQNFVTFQLVVSY